MEAEVLEALQLVIIQRLELRQRSRLTINVFALDGCIRVLQQVPHLLVPRLPIVMTVQGASGWQIASFFLRVLESE